ncbi:MAG TPA: carbohydrate porin [Steroidobacter sp.]|uniref:carbohydrate porin n=1 Tax=Steroidobacter sp. TaxID=1978227 RepID=UPI002ED799D5
MLIERGERSLNGFLRVGFEHSNVHQLSHYVGAGLVWSGPLLTSAEREEQLGIAVGSAESGRPFRRAQATLGWSVQRNETTIELTYRVQALPWLALQPDVQHVINRERTRRLKMRGSSACASS